VHVLIRPRSGDFCYSPGELGIMARDIAAAAGAGAAGVVFGALSPEGCLDSSALRPLLAAAHSLGLRCTLHRAVDVARDPVEAACAAAALGFELLLTSGGAGSALEGVATICAMASALSQQGSRLTLIAGGGLRPCSAAQLSSACRGAGVQQFHGTAREPGFQQGSMLFRKQPTVFMGSPRENSEEAEYGVRAATPASVAELLQQLREGAGGQA